MPSQPVVLVTGSSAGGLGHAICKEFRAQGYRVFATSRRLESMKSLESDGCDILALDVSKPDSVAEAAKELSVRTGGRLDIIVNNAALISHAPSITEDPAITRSVIDTNLLGPILVAQAFVPLIIKSNGGKAGMIVNISSGVAVAAHPWVATYGASKAGLMSLTSAWRMELKGFGVRAIHVVAGTMNTNALPNGIAHSESSEAPLYWNWEDIYAHFLGLLSGAKAAEPADVARDIVAAATRRIPPLDLYVGGGGWIFKYVPYLPLSWIESIFGPRLGAHLVSYRP